MSEFDILSSPSIVSELMLSDSVEDLRQEPKIVTREREPQLNVHERYHIQDQNVVFVVEDTEFKIYTHFLTRESMRLKEMIAQAPPNGRVSLPDVTAEEFEDLLDLFYEGMYDFQYTLNQWISILRVSTLYDLPLVRERAIREVNADRHELELDPVGKIELALNNDVPEWLARAYEALCQRERGLDDEEAQRLGVVTTNGLWAARETVRKLNGSDDWYSRSSPNPPNVWKEQRYSPSTVTQTVSNIFWPPPPPQPAPDLTVHELESPQLEPCETSHNAGASTGGKKKKRRKIDTLSSP